MEKRPHEERAREHNPEDVLESPEAKQAAGEDGPGPAVKAKRALETTPRRRPARPVEYVLACLSAALVVAMLAFAFGSFALVGTVRSLFTSTGANTNAPEGTFSILYIVGTIQSSGSDGSYQHSDTLRYIKKMKEDPGNKGILLYMNTGGGGMYESDEVYRALEDYKDATGRPVWAYMADTCASGGYYICMAAQRVIANYNSLTGSIGVYIQMTDTSGLYEKLGIETVLIRSGENKGTGVAGVEISDGQRAVYQSIVDEKYDRFVELVAQGRDIEEKSVRELADGRPYTAVQAEKLGLVDELSDWDATLEAFKGLTGGESFTPSFSRQTMLGSLLGSLEETLPKGETQTLLELADGLPNGVPMAYAPGLGWE